jgi:hypothetical protein
MAGSLAHKLLYYFRTVPGMPGRGFYVVPMLALGLGGGDLAAAKTGDVCRSGGAGVLHAPICLLIQANTVILTSCQTATPDYRSVVSHCRRILTVTLQPPLRTPTTNSQTPSILIKIPSPLILQTPAPQSLSPSFFFQPSHKEHGRVM